MHSLTNCCAHEGAEQGSTPYQRLPRCPSSSLSGPNITNENPHSSHTSRRFDLARLDRRPKCQSTSPNGSFSSSSASFNADSNNCLPDKASHKHANTAAMSPDAGSNSCATQSQVEISCHVDNACNSIRTSDISQVQKTAINCVDQDTKDINTVLVKVCIIGDSGTGKTSFMAKYGGLNLIDNGKDAMLLRKICKLQDANIALHVWDFGGQSEHIDKVPSVCKDAAAIFIMFDLTRRSTLQSLQKWYTFARKSNKVAMVVLIGNKYDGFVQMSKTLQLAIFEEAMQYSSEMEAALFFSSVLYNINIQKVFKIVLAKLFDLPCNISKNFNFGEPIIYF